MDMCHCKICEKSRDSIHKKNVLSFEGYGANGDFTQEDLD